METVRSTNDSQPEINQKAETQFHYNPRTTLRMCHQIVMKVFYQKEFLGKMRILAMMNY